jgi:hypothetical protein
MIPQEIKINIRDLVIVILIGLCLWFYLRPLDLVDIEQVKKDNLEKKELIDKIEQERRTLSTERKILDSELERLRELASFRSDTINFYRRLSRIKDTEIKDLKENLKLYNQMLEKRNQQIDELLKKPIILPKNQLVDKTKEKLK